MSHRTQIILTDRQYSLLKREAERNGVGLAELVRRALTTVYGDSETQDAAASLAGSFGAWRDRDEDGAAYGERLRRGMQDRLAE